MKKETLFNGVATALVTPFKNGRIDYYAFDKLIAAQLEAGISALLVCGTTGEPCSLSYYERSRLLEYALRRIDGAVVSIAGTGTNDTKRTCEMTKQAERMGYDAALIVTPYYNKASQSGLIAHYRAVSESSELPFIIYNVPPRTGMNVEPETYRELAKIRNAVAVKEASASFLQLIDAVGYCGGELDVYCGNEDYALASLLIGGKGIISVASNVFPAELMRLYDAFKSGDNNEMFRQERRLTPFMRAMFCDINPTPVKYALSLLGICTEEMRLPLIKLDERKKERVRNAFYMLMP